MSIIYHRIVQYCHVESKSDAKFWNESDVGWRGCKARVPIAAHRPTSTLAEFQKFGCCP